MGEKKRLPKYLEEVAEESNFELPNTNYFLNLHNLGDLQKPNVARLYNPTLEISVDTSNFILNDLLLGNIENVSKTFSDVFIDIPVLQVYKERDALALPIFKLYKEGKVIRQSEALGGEVPYSANFRSVLTSRLMGQVGEVIRNLPSRY